MRRRAPLPRGRAYWPVRTRRVGTTILALPVNLTAATLMVLLWATVLFVYWALWTMVAFIVVLAEA